MTLPNEMAGGERRRTVSPFHTARISPAASNAGMSFSCCAGCKGGALITQSRPFAAADIGLPRRNSGVTSLLNRQPKARST